MSLLTELAKNTNKQTLTENWALTNKSTLDPLLDFFSRAGAMRGREDEAVKLFQKAYDVDKEAAVRCVFYLRDIRGGQGERSVFRAILKKIPEEDLKKIYNFIPEYGRWDEVPINEFTSKYLYEQFVEDEDNMKDGKSVSLLAKWLPSENTSNKETRNKAKKLMELWDLKPRQYRQRLVALRKYIKILEQQMSAKKWSQIQYDKLPSQAHRKHVKAFKRNDQERYEKYIAQVATGEKKINAKTLFTYEIYEMVQQYDGDEDVADQLWKALPDYTQGINALVLADVSGSMTGRPMAVSVSLALYFAERNEGPFKDHFLTFTTNSQLQRIKGSTLSAKMRSIESSGWHGSTSIQSAFNAILKAANDSKASQDEMPRVLYIISDMEFNMATMANDETNFEVAQRKFKEAGYELPHVVFWQVDSRNDQVPATMYDDKVTLISGSNQSAFKYAVEGKTPLETMTEILTSERYSKIKL